MVWSRLLRWLQRDQGKPKPVDFPRAVITLSEPVETSGRRGQRRLIRASRNGQVLEGACNRVWNQVYPGKAKENATRIMSCLRRDGWTVIEL